MIKKVVKKSHLKDPSSIKRDLAYWLSRAPEERVATVDYLRRQISWEDAYSNRVQGKYGDITIFYIGRDQFISNKKAMGRKRDLADLEALGEE